MIKGVRESGGFRFVVSMLVLLTFFMIFIASVSAHGYVSDPKSRALLCKEGANVNCGGIQYEPQSVEAPKGYPGESVPDGMIAGGGKFTELDEQTADRWAKVDLSSGAYTFTWTLTAAHATTKWDYYITKENWDPNSPLTRDSLELFCTYNDGGKRPDFSVSHQCDIPARSGYHVIFAYWEIDDTGNAFYQVIDAQFDGNNNPATKAEPNKEVEETPEIEEPAIKEQLPEELEEVEVEEEFAEVLEEEEEEVIEKTFIQKISGFFSRLFALIGWVIYGDNVVENEEESSEVKVEGDLLVEREQIVEGEPVVEDEPIQESNPVVEGDNKAEDAPEWQPDVAYHGGEFAKIQGTVYMAKWWTQGENPINSEHVWEQQ